MDGLEATRLLMTSQSPPRVLMLTTFDLDEYVYDALRAGASGFLLKDVRPEQLADAVRAVAAGDALLAPTITRRLVEQYLRRPPPGTRTPPGLTSLTDRELEVLRLVARGRSNQQIASTLFLGESTVKTHLTHLFAKLGLRDRAQAVVLAYESGLVQPGDD
jgi:DNA-binding NarL/FixJ family response regulator